jgi:hypothetical protein
VRRGTTKDERRRHGRGSALGADSGEAPWMADDRRTAWARSSGCCMGELHGGELGTA